MRGSLNERARRLFGAAEAPTAVGISYSGCLKGIGHGAG